MSKTQWLTIQDDKLLTNVIFNTPFQKQFKNLIYFCQSFPITWDGNQTDDDNSENLENGKDRNITKSTHSVSRPPTSRLLPPIVPRKFYRKYTARSWCWSCSKHGGKYKYWSWVASWPGKWVWYWISNMMEWKIRKWKLIMVVLVVIIWTSFIISGDADLVHGNVRVGYRYDYLLSFLTLTLPLINTMPFLPRD